MLPPETFDLARIRLRRPTLADAAALSAAGNDPEVARFASWPMGTPIDSTRQRLRQRAEDWVSGAEYYWVITLVDDDRAIGAIACRVEQRAAEFGFLLERRHWGNGYATDAARAVVEWLLSLPSVRRVWATCDTDNVASARVLEKAGLSREAVLPRAIVRPNISDQLRDAFVYSRLRYPCRLIAPHADYEASHRTFLQEFTARAERVVPWIVAEPYVTFQGYVAMLAAASRGIGLRDGGVPHSTFWWVDANEILGVSNLRHRLTDRLAKFGGHIGYGVRPSARQAGHATELLRATLAEARKLKLRRVLLTCDKRNEASAKTILGNGGVLDGEELMPEYDCVVCRYWIDL